MSRFLVTGGAGFIGSNLVKDLIKRHEIIVIDDMSSGSFENLKEIKDRITFIKANAGDALKISPEGLDGIFHLGTTASSIFFRDDRSLAGQAIVEFTSLLELAKRENCKLVYASTSSIYNGNKTPYKETQLIHIADFYSEVRYYFERLSQLYYNMYGTKSIGLRFFSVYGPSEEHKKDRANLVSQFLWAMQKGESPVIWGDGKQERDFIYVGDVISGMKMAMQSKVKHDVFNIGTGKSYPLNKLVTILNKVLGQCISAVRIENPLKDRAYFATYHKADITKAKKQLGFTAKVSLEEGIKKLL